MNNPLANLDEPSRLRVEWLLLLGHNWAVIENSLRYDRPQSVEEERYLVESVRVMMEWTDKR